MQGLVRLTGKVLVRVNSHIIIIRECCISKSSGMNTITWSFYGEVMAEEVVLK